MKKRRECKVKRKLPSSASIGGEKKVGRQKIEIAKRSQRGGGAKESIRGGAMPPAAKLGFEPCRHKYTRREGEGWGPGRTVTSKVTLPKIEGTFLTNGKQVRKWDRRGKERRKSSQGWKKNVEIQWATSR